MAISPSPRVSEVRILRKSEVLKLTGLSTNWISELERRGEFPKRRQLSGKAFGWLLSEVEAWIEARPPLDVPAAVDEPEADQQR